VGMVLAIRCHRQNMKTSIINGSEVSRLSVAIHSSVVADLAELAIATNKIANSATYSSGYKDAKNV
ncbi:hypothetical protein NGF82_02210, partial [Klebsiella pneumoniae]|nr:hypothetical protein [Klebsiella pneumoniae]